MPWSLKLMATGANIQGCWSCVSIDYHSSTDIQDMEHGHLLPRVTNLTSVQRPWHKHWFSSRLYSYTVQRRREHIHSSSAKEKGNSPGQAFATCPTVCSKSPQLRCLSLTMRFVIISTWQSRPRSGVSSTSLVFRGLGLSLNSDLPGSASSSPLGFALNNDWSWWLVVVAAPIREAMTCHRPVGCSCLVRSRLGRSLVLLAQRRLL